VPLSAPTLTGKELMQLFTLAQIKEKLSYDLDIFDGDFINLESELPGYINEAIDDAEAIIHKLYEDYFLSRATITLVNGTAQYALPTDIYSAKIRGIYYNDGTKKYEIKRIKKFSQLLNIDANSDEYGYILLNNGATNTVTGNFKIELQPPSREASSSNVTIFYIRNAKRLSADTDYCDIPEFINFIYAHVKYNVSKKEKIGQDLTVTGTLLREQKLLMEQVLSDMVPDEGNNIEGDMSFYQDFDDNTYTDF
jgi:hypothetical protein